MLKLPSDTDPFNFNINSIKARDEPRPNATSHPNIRFWHRVDYDAWLDSPAAKRAQRGTVPFLEDESGQPITAKMIKAIREGCRAAWAELVVRDIAPSTWARLCSTGNLVVRQMMEHDFPIFRLDSDGWKLKLLCTNDYPNWRKNHLDFDGTHWTWKTSDKKATKQETSSEDDMDVLPDPEKKSLLKHKGKKRAHSPDNTSSIKRVKDTPTDSAISSFSSNDEIQETSDEFRTSSPAADHDTDSDAISPYNKIPAEPSNNFTPLRNLSALPLILPPSPRQPNSSPPHGVYLPQPPSHRHDNKENMPVFLKNPLANMFTTKAPPRALPLLDNSNSPLHPRVDPSTSAGVSTAATITSAGLTSSTAAPTPTTSTKGSKMRPGPKKNGRNLCALRWLKQLNTKGTTKEFDSYWCALSTAQKDEYQAEAERLESAGQWQKPSDALVVNGPLR